MCMVFPFKASEETAMGNPDLKEQMMTHERETVLKNLQNCGLHVHCFYSRDRLEIFCKIGANAQKLRDTASRMKYKLQLKPDYLSGYAEYRNDFPGRPELHHQDRRMVNHIYKTFSTDDYPSEDAIFSTRDKITIVHHIISSKDRDCAGINTGQLLHTKDLAAYFPLHEESLLKDLCSEYRPWLFMGNNHAMQVRDYFGEKVTLYFLFMSYYWKALLIPAVFGLLIQPVSWYTQTPDNKMAVPFCIFIAVWSVLLPHFWKRQEAKFSIQWGTIGMEPEMEPYRPQFWGPMQINPVTNQVEPHYSWGKRAAKYVFSFTVIAITGVILISTVVASLIVRHMSQTWALPDNMRQHRILIFMIVFAVVVEVTNSCWSVMAKKLTDWENHRTSSEYDHHKLIKVMLFKFVNSYFILYYVAFFKVQLNLFGMECMQDDCMVELDFQLGVFVAVRLTLSNAAEFAFPRLIACFRAFAQDRKAYIHNMRSYTKLEMADMSSAEQQSKKEPQEVFSEFDETLISHGYASLFAVSSPWVCAATLIWVMLECIIDVKGMTESRRRPLPVSVHNNEPWTTALELYGFMACITNITLLVFASQQYSGNSFPQRMFLWVYLLHIIFFFRLLVVNLFPEMPRSVETLRQKQDIASHRCLENIEVKPEQDFSLTRHQRTVKMTCHETDYHDQDAEEAEPKLELKHSIEALGHGLVDGLSYMGFFILIGTFALAVVTAIMIRAFGIVA